MPGSPLKVKQGKESSFSEEKEPKRLLLTWSMGCGRANAPGPESKKSFCFFFFRKRSA
jgi:hypothetical protein